LQFFLRTKPGTPYPNLQAVYALRDKDGDTCGEWRCGGGSKGAQTVIFGTHPDGPTYQILIENSPVELVFDVLRWFSPFNSPGPTQKGGNTQTQSGPTHFSGQVGFDPQAAYAQMLDELGEPFIKTQRSYSINQSLFARLFGIRRLAFWDIKSQDYYAYTTKTGAYDRLYQEEVLKLIKADIFAEATQCGVPTVGSKVNASLLKSIAELIRSDELASRKDFFARSPRDLPVIHAANGMFRLEEDGAFSRHKFSPEFRSRNPIGIEYDKNAQAPKFKSQLLEGLSAEDKETLQRYYGLVLIGGNRAQKLLMLLGKGGTGKGTIVRLGNLVIGRSNIGQLRVGEIDGRFESYRLLGKLLLTVVEATYDCLQKSGAEIIKALVGHDPMDAEKKNVAAPISFDGNFPIIYVSNEDPNIRLSGDESAWERRLVPLLFPKERPSGSKIVDNYEEVIFEEEARGVFAWMMEGAIRHWKELINGEDFARTDVQKRRVQEIIARSKSVLSFVLDGLKASLTTGDLTTDELYDGYVSFCNNNRWHSYPERKFAEIVRPLILQHFGVSQSHDVVRPKPNGKTATLRGYRGLELK
jgi:putative DNA primase/helicase